MLFLTMLDAVLYDLRLDLRADGLVFPNQGVVCVAKLPAYPFQGDAGVLVGFAEIVESAVAGGKHLEFAADRRQLQHQPPEASLGRSVRRPVVRVSPAHQAISAPL